MTMFTDEHVLLRRQGGVGRITLDRPAKINALTVEMIMAVHAALEAWADDGDVLAVVIDGAGDRGLCAGGDIAAVFHGLRGDDSHPERFWADEYRMNLAIAEYPKPIVALMDGVTLGGGVGISGHASVRVVTETSQIGMPETAIGLSPDGGGLYLLARAPGELGTHAALTGVRLGPADAIAAGLADHFVPRDRLAELMDRLAAAADARAVRRAVTGVDDGPPRGRWPDDRAWIDACYAGDDAQIIAQRLADRPEAAARHAAKTLQQMSPTAVAVTLRAIRNAARMSLAEVLEQDLMLSMRFARHPDFVEGIRARIIDKDRSPHWQPASLAEVTRTAVDTFFAAGAPATGADGPPRSARGPAAGAAGPAAGADG